MICGKCCLIPQEHNENNNNMVYGGGYIYIWGAWFCGLCGGGMGV